MNEPWWTCSRCGEKQWPDRAVCENCGSARKQVSRVLDDGGNAEPAATLVRVYRGRQQADAVRVMSWDADQLAASGYYPTSQSWAQGQWGAGAFVVAILLFIVLIGIVVFLYMLIVKPEGTLTVTYALREPTRETNTARGDAPVSESSPDPDRAEGQRTPAMKRCPDCAEVVRAEARICRYCRYEFAPPARGPGDEAA